MKTLISASLLVAALSSFAGTVTISGEIKNAPKNTTVRIYHYNNPVEYKDVTDASSKLDENGKFTLSFEWGKPAPAIIEVGDEISYMYLTPNDKLNVTTNYTLFDEELKYSGAGSLNCQFLADELNKNFAGAEEKSETFNEVVAFVHFIDSSEAAHQSFFNSRSTGLSPEFKNYKQADIKSLYVRPRLMFSVDMTVNPPKMRELPANYYEFANSFDLNNQEAAVNDNYIRAIETLFQLRFNSEEMKKSSPALLSTIDGQMTIRMNAIAKRLDGNLKNIMLTKYILELQDYGMPQNVIDDLYSVYKIKVSNPEYIAMVDKVRKKKQDHGVGAAAPALNLVDKSGKAVNLEEFKGKYVLVDFWATWCGPCMKAMPKEEELMKKYANRSDLVFLMVNISDTEERWKKYIDEKKPGGVHWFGDKLKSAEISSDYDFNGIPHWVIIDKDGKFLNDNVGGIEDVETALAKLK